MGQSLFSQDLIDKIFKTESQKELNIVSCNTVANSSAVCKGGSLQVSHVLSGFCRGTVQMKDCSVRLGRARTVLVGGMELAAALWTI